MTFHYNVGPSNNNRWRARPVNQGTRTPEEHTAAVVARCAAAGVIVTDAVAAAVIGANDHETIAQAAGTFAINYPGGLTRMIPSTSGSHATPDFEGTYDNLAPDAASYLTKTGRDLFRAGFASQLGEVNAEKGAVITRVVNMINGHENSYTPTRIQCIEGRDLDGMGRTTEDPNYTGTGAFYTAVADGAVTPVSFDDFGPKRPSQLTWTVPNTLTGLQTLSLKVWLNGGLRTTIWPEPVASGA